MGELLTRCGKSIDHMSTRERIIHAAFELISHDGKDGLTTRKVTEKAGVGKGTLYHHFANMEDLLIATMDSMIDHHMAEMMDITAEDATDFFDQLGENLLSHLEFHKSLGNGIFSIWETILNNPKIKAATLSKMEEKGRTIGERLMEFYPGIPFDDLEECVVMLFAIIAGVENMIYLSDETEVFIRMWKRFTQMLRLELKSREV